MVTLGLAVGNGSTPVDDWFHQYGRGPAKWLLFFTDPRVLASVVLAALAVAVYRRRWRLAVAAVVSTAARDRARQAVEAAVRPLNGDCA